MSASARNQHLADACAAPETRLSSTAINLMQQLKLSRASLGIHIIGDGGAAPLNGELQNFPYSLIKSEGALPGQPGGPNSRMNACVKESFIRIDVADPAQKMLVQQKTLQHGAPGAKELKKVCKRNLQRVRSQPAQLVLKMVGNA